MQNKKASVFNKSRFENNSGNSTRMSLTSPNNMTRKSSANKSPPLKFRLHQSKKTSGGVFSSFNKTCNNFTSPINLKMSKGDGGWTEKERDQ